MHYEELQIADTSFNTHEQLQIFEQPDSQLFRDNIYYSQWKTSQKYTEEDSTRTQVQEVKHSHS